MAPPASPRARQVALLAAAALAGPSAPSGIVDRRTEHAVAAVIRVAELFLPWLEGADPPEPKSGTEGEQSPKRRP